MNIKPICGLAAISLLLACQSNLYKIDGFAKELQDGDTISLSIDEGSAVQQLETTVSQGKFLFSGEVDTVRLCRAYVKNNPDCYTTLFIEPGYIAVELSSDPYLCRVSGTNINNEWQQLADSINMMMRDIEYLIHTPAPNDSAQHMLVHHIDSLHRKMSDCIIHTGQRNSGNRLGKYIDENYKAPDFK